MFAVPRSLRMPSFALLLSLAALILLEPVAERFRGGVPVLAALHLAVLGLAVRLVGSTRDQRRVAWLLAAPTIALNLASLLSPLPALDVANLGMSVLFYGYVTRCLIAYVLRDAIVTLDELLAAACTYVLMAMVFACLYALLEWFEPDSFALPALVAPNGGSRYWDLLYFSFTVLTSTGFGDIHPIARQARAIVMVEQVSGVMYVAILIARLAGMAPIGRTSQTR